MNRDNGGRKDTAGCELREFIILRVLLLFTQWRVILKVLSLSFLNMIITEEDHFTKWPESQPNLKSPLTKAYVTVLVRRLISMTKPSSCWQWLAVFVEAFWGADMTSIWTTGVLAEELLARSYEALHWRGINAAGIGEMWSHLLVCVKNLAAAFCVSCSLWMSRLLIPE